MGMLCSIKEMWNKYCFGLRFEGPEIRCQSLLTCPLICTAVLKNVNL